MCSWCNTAYYGESHIPLLIKASEHLGMTPLTGKWIKIPEKVIYHWPHATEESLCQFWKLYGSLKRKKQI